MRKLLLGVGLAALVAAGALVFVGLPALNDDDKPADAERALNAITATDGRAPTGLTYYLVLNGKDAGVLTSFKGGVHVGEVVDSGEFRANVFPKNIAKYHIEPIVIQANLGSGLARPLWDAVQQSWKSTSPVLTGSVLTLNSSLVPVDELKFTNATITKTEMPNLDGAASTVASTATVTLAPASVQRVKPTSLAAKNKGTTKSSFVSNFKVTLGTLATTKVSDVAGIVRETGKGPGNLHISVSAIDKESWQGWYESFVISGQNGQESEKSGLIELMTSDLKYAVAKLDLSQCGIFRLVPELSSSDSIARVGADLYCESTLFTVL